jgi:cbb3-type cytochrome oxidase maturation protein
MNVLYLLIPIALVILVIAIKLLFWAINNGQYDDLDMEGHRILFDDDDAQLSKKKSSEIQPFKNKSPEIKAAEIKAPKNKSPQYESYENRRPSDTKNRVFVNKNIESIDETKSAGNE